jgi:hypothetical protein
MKTTRIKLAAIGLLGIIVGISAVQLAGCTKPVTQSTRGDRLELIESENLGSVSVALIRDTKTGKEYLICPSSTPLLAN